MQYPILRALRASCLAALLAVIASVCLWGASANANPIVYSQPPEDGARALTSAYWSQVATWFRLEQDEVVTGINWWGTSYYDEGFQLRFFEDEYTEPGPIQPKDDPFVDVPALDLNQTLTGVIEHDGKPIYKYSASLSQAVSLSGETNYYLMILETEQSGPDVFQWMRDGGDSHWHRGGDDHGVWPRQDGPSEALSFELVGIPEPSTALLLAGGLVGIALRRRLSA